METCDKNMEKACTRAGKRAEKLSAKPHSRDSSPEESICQSLSGMTLEERERQLMVEITAIKLENRVVELEAERDRLLLSCRERGWPTFSSPGQPMDETEEQTAGATTAGHTVPQEPEWGRDRPYEEPDNDVTGQLEDGSMDRKVKATGYSTYKM